MAWQRWRQAAVLNDLILDSKSSISRTVSTHLERPFISNSDDAERKNGTSRGM